MGRQLQVLIIDDDGMMRDLLRIICEKGDAEMTDVSTCREAEKIIQFKSFDLVLLDNNLPDGVGLEFLPYAKYFCERIIMITADEKRLSELAISLGAEAVFPKPFSMSKLRECIFRR